MRKYINNPVVLSNTGYLVFFDNVRVDQFVKDYTVSMGINSGIGTASINMVYVPDLDKILHSDVASTDTVQEISREVSPQSSSQKAKVINCYHLAIREGPGMNYPEIDWVDAGDVLDYHGKGGKNDYWINVTVPGGKKGWAGGKYIEIQEVESTKSQIDSGNIVVGSRVKIKSSATNYFTGQRIPLWVKEKVHTVQQLESNKALLKEIISWVNLSDIALESGGTSTDNGSGGNSSDSGFRGNEEDGVENMTNVRIFVKNIFNEKYVQIFGGNITSKSTTITGNEKTLSFQAQDYMNWLSRTVCPIAVPYDNTLTSGDRLKWKAQGIDLDKVQSVNSVKDITFKGKTLSETWDIISKQTIDANKLYSNPDSVSKFDDALKRVVIMGDIDENLRKAEVVDFMITSSLTQVNSTYVLMNDILKTLMFEFYQDRDETIRIKPPFWNEHVIKDHVIDPSLIISYTESTNYSQMYTRVLATGGLEEWNKDTSTTLQKMMTPVVAVTSSGISGNSGPVAITSNGDAPSASDETTGSIAASACEIAKRYVGWPYIYGAESPQEGGFDCSGLIYYAYKQAGYTGWTCRETTTTMIQKGTIVGSYNDLKVGDAIFPNSGHVYMYIGNNQIIEAQRTGTNIMIRKLPRESNIGIRRFTTDSGGVAVSNSNPVKPESVGPDSLLEPTALEKKYGPLIYDCSQPLIKFSTSGAVGADSSYDALTKYAKFMLNYLNSSVTMSSVQVIGMPWLRPGFNVWIDPVNTDKVYYINQINHYGNQAGNYSTLNLTMGRKRKDFVSNKTLLGGLKPGNSDDIFVNSLTVTPENFGTKCNYGEIESKVKSFYYSSNTDRNICSSKNSYFSYFYGEADNKKSVATVSRSVATEKVAKFEVGGKVKLKSSASRYFTGEKIPNWVKEKNHTIQQVETNKILLKEIYSWVKREDIDGVEDSASSASSGKTGVVINVSSHLNVRNGPGTSHGIVGKLYNSNSVNILNEKDGWYNIDFNGNTNAWVSKNYIKITDSDNASSSSSSNYNSHSDHVFSNSQNSILEIQSRMNSIYSNANSVVKSRSSRLSDLVSKSEKLMKYMHASEEFNRR